MRPTVRRRVDDWNARARRFAPPIGDSARPDFARYEAVNALSGEALKEFDGSREMRVLEARSRSFSGTADSRQLCYDCGGRQVRERDNARAPERGRPFHGFEPRRQ